jgi:hypothetical protein
MTGPARPVELPISDASVLPKRFGQGFESLPVLRNVQETGRSTPSTATVPRGLDARAWADSKAKATGEQP